MKKAILTFSYVAVIALIIFLADHQSTTFVFHWLRAIPGGDKIGHFLLIGGFSFVVNYGLSCRTFRLLSRNFLLGSIIVAILITAEEFSQLFISTRTFDLVDLFFDLLGIWVFGKLAMRAVRSNTAVVQSHAK